MLTFVISNTTDTVRTQSSLKQFEEQGIVDYKVMPAIMEPKMARRGISRSHKACVQIAKDRGEPCVHIHEDDIWYLQKGAYKRFLDIYHTEVPKDADLFLGGGYDGVFTPISPRLAINSGKHAGFFCYIVNEKFYDVFLQADEYYNIDYFLTCPELTESKCYTASPFIALQFDGFSYNTQSVTTYNNDIHRRYSLWNGVD